MAVPQTYQDVIDLLNTAVNRDDIAPSYMDFINRAVRDIAVLHSFDQMSATATLSLGIGANQVTLPADFKDLQPGRFPVYASIGGAAQAEIPVFRKEEISRIQSYFLANPSLIYTSDNNGFQLGFLPGVTATQIWNILLYYFAYPPVITDPTEGTPLLTFYPNLVIARVLSLIFQSINDPVWETHDKNFASQMAAFTGADIEITHPEKSN